MGDLRKDLGDGLADGRRHVADDRIGIAEQLPAAPEKCGDVLRVLGTDLGSEQHIAGHPLSEREMAPVSPLASAVHMEDEGALPVVFGQSRSRPFMHCLKVGEPTTR